MDASGRQCQENMAGYRFLNSVMLGLDPSIFGKRVSGLRFASPENDG